jgi:predicted N-acyltransferase
MAFNLASPARLYGRYWGAVEEHPFLHFNVALYHSIEECIRRGVGVFEGGAGGEHKLARGFEPAETYAAHLVADRRLDVAVRRHLAEERGEREGAVQRWRVEHPRLGG